MRTSGLLPRGRVSHGLAGIAQNSSVCLEIGGRENPFEVFEDEVCKTPHWWFEQGFF